MKRKRPKMIQDIRLSEIRKDFLKKKKQMESDLKALREQYKMERNSLIKEKKTINRQKVEVKNMRQHLIEMAKETSRERNNAA